MNHTGARVRASGRLAGGLRSGARQRGICRRSAVSRRAADARRSLRRAPAPAARTLAADLRARWLLRGRRGPLASADDETGQTGRRQVESGVRRPSRGCRTKAESSRLARRQPSRASALQAASPDLFRSGARGHEQQIKQQSRFEVPARDTAPAVELDHRLAVGKLVELNTAARTPP